MAQVIVHTNENGNVTLTIPAPEYLIDHTIEEVKAKDTPEHSIIIDDSELPESDEFFDAWEIVGGKVVVNQTKKQAIIDAQNAKIAKKATAEAKLAKLGLTTDDLKVLLG